MPVLAIGSNRSVAQLIRKFPEAECLPVERCRIIDYDVVYGARISGYGAVPATLIRSPGTQVDVAITWLSPAQLEIMDRSEGLGDGYCWATLPGEHVSLERLHGRPIGVYVTARGAWAGVDGDPVALAAVNAIERRLDARHSAWVLSAVNDQIGGADSFETFLQSLVGDGVFRSEVRQRIGDVGLVDATVILGQPTRESGCDSLKAER